jgi:hypothetical protein
MSRKHHLKKKSKGCGCFYCGSMHDLTVEHVLPKSLFQKNKTRLLALACRQCNTDYSDLMGSYDHIVAHLSHPLNNPIRTIEACKRYLLRMKRLFGKDHIHVQLVHGEISEIISLCLGDSPLTFAHPII